MRGFTDYCSADSHTHSHRQLGAEALAQLMMWYKLSVYTVFIYNMLKMTLAPTISPLVIPLAAETSMPDDFLCDPPGDTKRYAVDPSDSAFNVMTSQYPPKHSYGYRRSSSCTTPVGLCRQASSPASFQEGNRNGEAAFYSQDVL